MSALRIVVPVGVKNSGAGNKAKRVQFSDVLFYEFLVSIGFMPRKSKCIGKITIPSRYFFDFLRGSFDGDGCFYSYFDPRWESSFMFYIVFVSASTEHINWLQEELFGRLNIKGHMSSDGKKKIQQLKYAKRESLKIIKNMYYSGSAISLSRKRKKIAKALKIARIDNVMPRW